MSYQMTEEEFKLFSDFVGDYAGLEFNGSQEFLFQKRIKKRIDANKLNNPKEYYHFLRFDSGSSEELRKLINLLTVNETYFFREEPQIEVLLKEILPLIKKKNEKSKTIRIWSAACSTGAEAYSMAILILESGLFTSDEWKVVIFGTDINSDALQVARTGSYTEAAFRTTDAGIRKKYFKEAGQGRWEVKDNVKKMVKFSRLNLCNPAEISVMRGMDVVLCRNVFIYFSRESKKAVAEMIYDSLVPDGLLVIGQTESLFKVTTLYDIKPMSNVMLYQKPFLLAGK